MAITAFANGARITSHDAIPLWPGVERQSTAPFPHSDWMLDLLCGMALAACDAAAFAVALACSTLLFPTRMSWWIGVHAAVIFVAMLGVSSVLGKYRSNLTGATQLYHLLVVTATGLGACAVFAVWSQVAIAPAPSTLVWAFFLIFAATLRICCRQALDGARLWRRNVVVVGAGEPLRRALAALESDKRARYRVSAVADPSSLIDRGTPLHEPAKFLARHGARMLVLVADADGWCRGAPLQALVRGRVPFAVIPWLDGRPVMGVEAVRFFSHDTLMFAYPNNLDHPVARIAKRLADFLLAGLLLIFISPVFALVALAVGGDGGAVFFGQWRIGAGGQPFRCLKFRSMVGDADAVLRDLLLRDPAAAAEWRASHKLRDDPRITRIGRFLRGTSLDELPQLLNVLRGEMSLVGPRPIVAAEVSRYAEDIVFYHATRPGLTGLWQVSGRSDTSYERRVELDCWYVKNWSVLLDLSILVRTLPAVLRRSGAV